MTRLFSKDLSSTVYLRADELLSRMQSSLVRLVELDKQNETELVRIREEYQEHSRLALEQLAAFFAFVKAECHSNPLRSIMSIFRGPELGEDSIVLPDGLSDQLAQKLEDEFPSLRQFRTYFGDDTMIVTNVPLVLPENYNETKSLLNRVAKEISTINRKLATIWKPDSIIPVPAEFLERLGELHESDEVIVTSL